MMRKWTVLGSALTAVVLAAAAGLSRADDKEETPTGKIMQKVGSKNTAINKAVRNEAGWRKGAKSAASDADELVRLFKEARDLKDASAKQKKPFEEWTKVMDAQIAATQEFADIARKPAAQPEAKAAYEKVKKNCTDCHNVFRPDEE